MDPKERRNMISENKFQKVHSHLIALVQQERKLTSQILDLLQKVEDEKLYLGAGFANLFDYLVRGLGYSESLAYQRKSALRLCKEIPEIKEKINQGSLSLATIARASRVLNTKSVSEKRNLLKELENKSSRQVDKILASDLMTQNFPCSGVKNQGPNELTFDLNPEFVGVTNNTDGNSNKALTSGALQVGVSVAASNKLLNKVTLELTEVEFAQLQKLKALKSHQVKNISELVSLLVDRELEKYNRTSNSSSKSKNPRQIKFSLKSHLLQKAKYQCQFPGCEQTHFLQIDHIQSVANNGTNRPENLQVLCQAHNLFKFRESQKTK
jgi:hypothetical protein